MMEEILNQILNNTSMILNNTSMINTIIEKLENLTNYFIFTTIVISIILIVSIARLIENVC